jgi:hypothetical protein
MRPQTENSKALSDNELCLVHETIAHPLPTDICQSNPDFELIIQKWPYLPEAVKASILMLVNAAFDGSA